LHIKGVMAMSSGTVRNLPDATHRALKLRAAQHGRSTEAEIRAILEAAVAPKLGIGTALAAIGRSVGGVELNLVSDQSAIEPTIFS
jgi:plasmid stability protein